MVANPADDGPGPAKKQRREDNKGLSLDSNVARQVFGRGSFAPSPKYERPHAASMETGVHATTNKEPFKRNTAILRRFKAVRKLRIVGCRS